MFEWSSGYHFYNKNGDEGPFESIGKETNLMVIFWKKNYYSDQVMARLKNYHKKKLLGHISENRSYAFLLQRYAMNIHGCEGHPRIGCCIPNCLKTRSGWCHSTTWKQMSGTTAHHATIPTNEIGGNADITVAV